MPDISGGAGIAAGAGGLLGGISGLFGGGGNDGTDAMLKAAGMQQASTLAAIEAQKQALAEARAYMQPFYETGKAGLNEYARYLGLPSSSGSNALAGPAPTATEMYRNTPGYEWAFGQGVNALERAAAAKGMQFSGPQAKGLTSWGQNIADQTYNNYLNRLSGLATSGQNAAALQGGYGMQSAPQIGNYLQQGALAQGAGLINAYNARQSAYQNMVNNIFGGVGMGLGAYQALPSGTKNWLNNALNWGGGSGNTPDMNWLMLE